MKRNAKLNALIVVLLAVAILLPAGSVMAVADTEPTPSTARLFVDGIEVATSHGGNEPFLVSGTTYLSIRALSTALGVDISWRPDTSTVFVGDAPEAQTVLITAGGSSNTVTIGEVLDIGDPADFTTQVGDDFSGWTLAAVLEHLQVDAAALSAAQYIVVTAANGTVAAIPANEALSPDNGHLIFEEDRGTVRIIMAQATSRGTWIRDVLEIGLDTQAANRNISIVVNGQAVTPTNVRGEVVEPFMVSGVIYLPVRAVAGALGMDINWDNVQNTIFLGDMPETIDTDEEPSFTVTAGTAVYTVTMSDVEALGIVDFYAIDRRGGGELRIDFTGVPIAVVLDSLGIALPSVESLTFTAANNNTGVIPADEALNLAYGFLAISENGEMLTSWAAGGDGPFRLVLAQDSFPQRWLRNVVDIAVEIDGEAQQATDAVVSITGTDGVTRIAAVDDIMELEARAVSATIRGDERNFTGVPLLDVFRLSGVNYAGGDTVILRALDGFSAIVLISEVLDEANAHLVWLEDGEPVTTDENTPFMLVLANDVVPMRFARYVSEITVLLPAAEMEVPEFGDYEFAIVAGGQTHVVTMEDFFALEPIDFYAEIRGGAQTQFTGLPLVTILRHLGINYSAFTTVICTAADHVSMEWTADEAFNPERGFIVVGEDGELLDDHYGPFRTVLVGAATNRWLRQLQVVTLR